MPSIAPDGSAASANWPPGKEDAYQRPEIDFALNCATASSAYEAPKSQTRLPLVSTTPAMSTGRVEPAGLRTKRTGTSIAAFSSEAAICPSRFGTHCSGSGSDAVHAGFSAGGGASEPQAAKSVMESSSNVTRSKRIEHPQTERLRR